MIVVAIIGLLAAIAIPNFVRARTTSQMNGCINHLRVIDSAKQQWALETGKQDGAYPAAVALAALLRSRSAGGELCRGARRIPPRPFFLHSYQESVGTIGTMPTCQILPGTHILP